MFTIGFFIFAVSHAFSKDYLEIEDQAPRDQMYMGAWSNGVKQFFGTAYESYDRSLKYSPGSSTAPISRVWYTGAEGVLTETYWPTVDMAQTRDSQILVTDGQNFFFEERRAPDSTVYWTDDGVPAFQVTTTDPQRRFLIQKVVFSDPNRDSIIEKYTITTFQSGLKFYLNHNPSVRNSSLHDSAAIERSTSGETALTAWEGDQAQAVLSSIGFGPATAAFEGPYGGYQQLRDEKSIRREFQSAMDGNVALTAQLPISDTVGVTEFTVVISFAETTSLAKEKAGRTLAQDFRTSYSLFHDQWASYQRSLNDLSEFSQDGGALYRASIAMLKSMEDKTYEGAIVAAPTVPWGQFVEDRGEVIPGLRAQERPRQNLYSGYHVVWPRDLYQMATTMLAVGDVGSAVATLNRLREIQFGPTDGTWDFGPRRRAKDGSFPQNFWVNGEPYWPGLQMDEVAFPVILTYRLWKAGAIELSPYWDMVKRASDFIRGFGPWSPQERWEEIFGASPSNIAAEITALKVASEMAQASDDGLRSNQYAQTAEDWAYRPGDNIDTWTFTTSGAHGNGKYYVRVEGASSYWATWNPNDYSVFYIANGGDLMLEKAVTDGGFLELVRLGVKAATDYHITESIPEIDQTIRVDVPGKGPGFRRYFADRYNRDNDNNGNGTAGMLWPLLSGERGHYELAKASLEGRDVVQATMPYLRAIENFATPTLMIPEQVWDYGDRAGLPTGSATPLGWSHAEYIKLLKSMKDGAIFDQVTR